MHIFHELSSTVNIENQFSQLIIIISGQLCGDNDYVP